MPKLHVDWRHGILSAAFATLRSASISTARTALSTREMVPQAVLAADGALPDTCATALVGAGGIRCNGGVINTGRGLGDRMPQAHVDWRRGIFSAAFATLRSASISTARTAFSTREVVPQAVLARHRSKRRSSCVVDTKRRLGDRMPQAHVNWRMGTLSTAFATLRSASIATARAALSTREVVPQLVLTRHRFKCGCVIDARRGLSDRMP